MQTALNQNCLGFMQFAPYQHLWQTKRAWKFKKVNCSQFCIIIIIWVFSHTDTFTVIWQLPAFTGGGRPHTYEYRNIRMDG